jgi:hypothetical protein
VKKFFQSRTLRERVLLLIFALIGFGWWAPVTLGRLGALQRELKDFKTDRETQQLWLSRRTEIEARSAAAARTLDPSKTLDASQAYAELSRMSSGLTAEIGSQRTQQSDQFALNNVQVTIRRADLAGLLHFYEQLAARAPYLGIEQCVISTDRANPGLLSAVFRVYSIEALAPTK